MKITELSLTPIKTARTTGIYSRHIILQILTDEGVTGWGEVADVGDYRIRVPVMEVLATALRRVLVDEDPRRIGLLHERLRRIPGMWGSAEAAVDMALYDIAGKKLGVHASELVGMGRMRDSVEVTYPIFCCSEPEHVGENIAHVERMYSQGWRRFRYYCGRQPDLDERFLTEFRDRYGDSVALTSLDFSGLRYWKDALQIIKRLMQFEPMQVESVSAGREPEDIARVRADVDVMVSEHIGTLPQAHAFVKAGAVDVFVVSIHSGGIVPALQVFDVALSAGVKCLLSTTQETSIGTAATAVLGAVAPELHMPGYAVGPVLYAEDVTRQPIRYDGAEMVIPSAPGLGVEVDEGKLAKVECPEDEWLPASAGSISKIDSLRSTGGYDEAVPK